MSLVQPKYLWWLLAIAVPVIIHLLHRGRAKTVKVGSVKFLKKDENNRSKNIRLNELLLLALRIGIVGLVVVLLAGLLMEKKEERAALTYFAAPEVLEDNALVSFLDSVAMEHPVKLFAKDFPDWDVNKVLDISDDNTNYWQLAKQLDGYPADSMVIFTKGYLSRVQSNRPEIDANIKWLVLEDTEPKETYVAAIENATDFNLVKQRTSGEHTLYQIEEISKKDALLEITLNDSLTFKKQAPVPIISADTLTVAFTTHPDFTREQEFFASAFKAISNYSGQPIQFHVGENGEASHSSSDIYIDLGKNPAPSNAIAHITFKVDSLQTDLFKKGDRANHYVLTKRLTIANVLQKDLVGQLQKILPLAVSSQQIDMDKRQLAAAELTVQSSDGPKQKKEVQPADMNPWLWVLLLLVIITERSIAKLRKQ